MSDRAADDLRAELSGLLRAHGMWWAEDSGGVLDDLVPRVQSIAECEHHSWKGLMALLDQHWPEDIFPTCEDDETRDAGARIVSLIRWVDRLRDPEWRP